MLKLPSKIIFLIFLSIGCSLFISAQDLPPLGSLEVSGRLKIGKKSLKLKRKRFHLLKGNLKDNQNLIEKLENTEVVSRNCFYAQMNASPEFICWLREERCESPYCRAITQEDISYVPEFGRAYQKGLRQFGRRRSHLARNWLTTNLSSNLRDGFYRQRKFLLSDLLSKTNPLQSAMTDTITVKAIFIDIPLDLVSPNGKKRKSETFLVSNLVPFEIDDKSYVWACEVKIREGKTAKLRLKVPRGDKKVKGCEVIIKDLPVCKAEGCRK